MQCQPLTSALQTPSMNGTPQKMTATTLSTEFALNAPANCGQPADPVRSVKVDKTEMMRTDSLQGSMVEIQQRPSSSSCSSFLLYVAQLVGSFLPISNEANSQPTSSTTAMRSSVETMRFKDLESAGAAPISLKPCRGCCLDSGRGSSLNILSTTCTENNWDSDDDCNEDDESDKWGPWIPVDGDVLRSPDKLRQFIEQRRLQSVVAGK